MTISKRGTTFGNTTDGNDSPLNNGLASDQFHRVETGTGAPAGEMASQEFQVGISAPSDETTPGFEVGIVAPGDVAGSGDAPADQVAPSGDSDGSLEVLGAWQVIEELTIAEEEEDATDAKGGGAGVDPTAANPVGNNIGQLLTLGTNPDGSHFFSGNRNVDAILIGSKWGTTNLTYSFPTSGTAYSGSGYDANGVSLYHIDLGPQQQAAARASFAQLSAFSGLTFTEITETDTVHANFRISQTADQDAPSAYGNFPSDTRGLSGDIWFGRTNQPYYDLAYKGTWGFATMMHEIGHTIGLKHGHQDYTNSDLSFYFGTAPRYGSQSLTPDRDGQAWSLMTYTPAPFTNSNFAGEKINQPQTYMQYDIAATQYMYGANFNTNSGDSVYTFSQTTGEMFINGVGQGAPSGNKIFLTIWDGGGTDTIDASNYANGVTIDLRPGEFSTVDQAQLANNLAYQNLVNLAPGNFAMSLLYNNDTRSLIENATGGTGNDIFIGNTANNVLDGGAGSDTVIFTGSTGVFVSLNDTNADVIVNHDGETDTLRSIENIQGTVGNDTLIGNSQNNTLSGGIGGADFLYGGAGDDRLIGGGFTVTTNFNPGTPASQPDIVKPATTNNGSIANAVNTAGFFDIDSNPNITNSTTVPHATINATATGGTVEYYRIDVTAAGAQAVFDIDGTGTLNDSIIELVDSNGTLLATNDTGPGDPGTTTGDDSYITYTFAAAGTYYIRVGRYTGTAVAQPMLANQTYQLNISLQGAAGTTTFTPNNTSSINADGGEGNDVILGTFGNDTIAGGNGNDTASFVTAYNGGGSGTTGVTVNLNNQGAAQNTVGAGNDTLTSIENLIGSQYNDTLTGDANNNSIEGGMGADVLVGGLGSDTASYAGAASGVTVGLGLQGAAQNTVGAGSDTLSEFENLSGSAFNDSLTGDANANTLTGGAGNDTLNPGANAGGTVDLLDGGLGSDTASFAGNAASVTATLNGATDSTATVGGLAIATLRSIENLTGGNAADILTGDDNANVIEGGLGDDVLTGGLGVDTLAFSGATAATVNLATTTAQATGWGSDTISGFENVRTGSGADNVTGDVNDNIFFEGGGNDVYNGAGGIDTLDYSAATSNVAVNLNTITAQNTGTSTGTDTLTNMENVIGSALFANTLTGNTVANRLTGGAAADLIEGRNGNDVIFGGAGNDFLLGGTGSSLDDGSSDTLEGGLGSDYLSGGLGNDILRGGEGDDTLNGTIGATNGGFFANDGGDDTYDGGDGTDIAIMAYENRAGVGTSTVGISFDIGSLAGNSDITWNGVSVGSLTSIERVTFRGTSVNDVVKGGGTLDSLTGNAGDDTLDGWYGNDTLEGGLGNDTLIGGEGLDTVTHVNSTAGVNVDLRMEGVAQNTGGAGTDTLFSIEYLTGSAYGDTLRGNDDFNLIVDTGVGVGATALSQTDSLFGYGGNDSIQVTRAAAAVATNINMDGGDGDDFIELRGGTLSAALATNVGGLSTATYMALGATSTDRNVDVVTVDGGAGNDRIVLSGVASATVSAGSGADIVSISMLGAAGVNSYQLTLGSGADIIQLGVGSNAANSTAAAVTARTNRVTDFERGDAGDKFEMTNFLNFGLSGYTSNTNAFASGNLRLLQSGSDLLVQVDRDGAGATNGFVTVFAISNGYTGGFTAFNFDGFIGNLTLTGIGALDETLTGATGNDVLSGGDGNDVLLGLAGDDTLNGGNGNDKLDGGTGIDQMNGGAGNDIYIVDNAGDVVTEAGNEGTDEVQTNLASYTLGANVENLTGTGNVAQTLTGNGLDNVITGGAGNDTIDGAGGTDTAAYSGPRSGYAITMVSDASGRVTGFSSVTDTDASNGDDGADTLTSIERLQFAGETLDLGQAVQLFDGNGTLVGTFSTIQAAVNASSAGYTVLAAAGTYAEIVTVDKDITIKGANAGTSGTGARGGETIIQGGFYMHADGATLDGLTVLGGGTIAGNSAGIYIDADNVTLTNLVVTGDGSNTPGLSTPYNGGVTGLAITNSLIQDWDQGTYFNPSTQFTATGNTFDDNGNAIVGDDWAAGTSINNNIFTDSVGSHIGYGSFDSVEDMQTYVGTGNTFGGTNNAVSIYAYGSGTGGQELTGTDQANGIYASEPDARNSTFHGLGGDDRLYGAGGNDVLDGGTGTDTAIYDGPRSDFTIVAVTDSDGRVTGFSSVTDNVAANGDEGADTLTSIEKLSFGGQVLDLAAPVQLFDANGNLVGTFGTIQGAIDASSDDYTIRVAAGTYTEDLTISHGVTILGAEAGNPVAGRDASGGTGETTIIGHAKVTATADVTLDGLRFLNNASTTSGGPALQFNTGGSTGHLVTNSIFWSTVSGAASDNRAIFSQVISSGSISITDNLISGTMQSMFGSASWGRAIWFDGGGVALVVTGNTIEWARTGINLDMSGDSTANIANNALQNLGTGLAVGVDVVGLTVSGNDVTRVGDDFNFRNLTTDVTFNAGTAIDTLTPVGNANDLVVILGGSGNDNLTGTAGADVIDGNNSPSAPNAADTDTLNGGAGDDQLFGRGGTDTLNGGDGVDMLDGGAGDDMLNGGEGIDTLLGGTGNDTLAGDAGDDVMKGGAGDDTYIVEDAGDTVTELANEGTDEVRTALGSRTDANMLYVIPDFVENMTGTATGDQGVRGNALDNVITLGAGNDLIVLDSGGNDTVNGGGGDDFIYYGATLTNADTTNGGGGYDTLGIVGPYSLTFDADDLSGIEKLALYTDGDANTAANFTIKMNDANVAAGETLFVTAASLQAGETLNFDGTAETNGKFVVQGGAGADTISGGAKTDFLIGNLGDDQLLGMAGNDTLVGGTGADRLTGGAGNDFFRFEAVSDSTFAAADVITDFTAGDKIDLSAIDANGNSADGNSAFTYLGNGNFTGHAGELRAFEVVAGKWFVVADIDGDSVGDLYIEVNTTGGHPIVAADFNF